MEPDWVSRSELVAELGISERMLRRDMKRLGFDVPAHHENVSGKPAHVSPTAAAALRAHREQDAEPDAQLVRELEMSDIANRALLSDVERLTFEKQLLERQVRIAELEGSLVAVTEERDRLRAMIHAFTSSSSD